MSFVAALLALVAFASSAAAQAPVGALAIDQRQGGQWGWAVDYETTAAAREVAVRECGTGCSVVLTFDRCGAYAADHGLRNLVAGMDERQRPARNAVPPARSKPPVSLRLSTK